MDAMNLKTLISLCGTKKTVDGRDSRILYTKNAGGFSPIKTKRIERLS